MNNNKIYLELGIGPLLFTEYSALNDIARTEDNIVAYNTYKLLQTRLGTHILGVLPLYIKRVSNNSNLLILEISVRNLIKIVTVDNDITSILINLDSINMIDLYETLYDYSRTIIESHKQVYVKSVIGWDEPAEITKFDFEYLYNNENKQIYYEEFLKTARILLHKQKPKEWKYINSDKFTIMAENKHIEVYGKTNRHGEALLGFSIYNAHYNHFTGGIKDKPINKLENKAIKEITMGMYNGTYTLDISDPMVGTINLLTQLVDKTDVLSYIKTDNYVILSNESKGIFAIACSESGINNIIIKNNLGERLDIIECVKKMLIIGVDSIPIENITFYSRGLDIGLDVNDIPEYRYIICINSKE